MTSSVICEYDDDNRPSTTREETEALCLNRLQNVAMRSGDLLTLWLENGRTKSFRTQTLGCETTPLDFSRCVYYWVSAFRPREHAFVIKVGHYECGHLLLVSSKTGSELKLSAFPRFSPDGKHFVSVDNSEACSRSYDIAIWTSGDPPAPEGEYNQPPSGEYENWQFVRWDGDSRIVLRVEVNEAGSNLTTYDAEAVLTRTGWQLNKLKPAR